MKMHTQIPKMYKTSSHTQLDYCFYNQSIMISSLLFFCRLSTTSRVFSSSLFRSTPFLIFLSILINLVSGHVINPFFNSFPYSMSLHIFVSIPRFLLCRIQYSKWTRITPLQWAAFPPQISYTALVIFRDLIQVICSIFINFGIQFWISHWFATAHEALESSFQSSSISR